MTNSLWGEIETAEEVVPPVTILKRQASELGKMTHQILQGDVEVDRRNDTFNLDFYITAPVLDNYRYWVLRLAQPMDMYPVRLLPAQQDGQNWIKCTDEEQLLAELAKVLSSPRIKRTIGMLLAQSKALSS